MSRLLLCGLCLLASALAAGDSAVARYSYRIVQDLPHDPRSFTQGLVVDGDYLIESSGLYGQSFLRRYHRLTGATDARSDLPRQLFAEGIALHGGRLFCLSWKAGRVLIYDKNRLRLHKTLPYRGQGWGLTSLGEHLLMSNGSSVLTLRNPVNFRSAGQIRVSRDGVPVQRLNDLTVIHGRIWANVWKETYLLAIDPATGEVNAELQLAALAASEIDNDSENVLNGIAWDEQLNGLWLTGKRWRRRYLLQLLPPAN